MSTCSKLTVLAASLLIASPCFAGLRDIRKEKLPQDQAIQKAYSDMAAIEDLVREWSPEWRSKTPKSEVASIAKRSLEALQKSLQSTPENAELLLLTGLVAHYAYNVELEEAYTIAVDSLEKAAKLAREDFRPRWFLGIHQCQTNHSKEGMGILLSIERANSWDQLPSGYWDDYLSCAIMTGMPAHALRAGERANKLEGRSQQDRNALMEIARKRFTAPQPGKNYAAREIWNGEKTDSQVVFTSSMFGLSFASHGEWQLSMGDVQKGAGMVQLQTGPHKGKTGDVFPNILVLARPPKERESLDDFLKSILPEVSIKRVSSSVCPSQECLYYEGVKAGMYKSEGDAHVLLTAFKRDAPEFPGLLFEEPTALPASEGGQPAYFRTTERLHRLKGTLYYLVMLDTASSVLERAKSDYQGFLKSIRVE